MTIHRTAHCASMALLAFGLALSADAGAEANNAANSPAAKSSLTKSPVSKSPVSKSPASKSGQPRLLESMVVSAHRVHRSLPTMLANVALGEADISRTLVPSLAAILRQQPGLDLTDAFADGSQTTLSLRGFGGDASANTLLVVDGQALNPADLSSPDLNAIELDDVERIEVLTGSSAVRYGDQATGGVIALATRPAGTGTSRLDVGIDSYHGRRYGVAWDGKFADIGARFTGKRVRSNGYRAGADFAKDDGLLRLNRQYASGRLELQLQRVDQDRLALGALTRAQVHDNPRRSGSKLNIHSRTDNGRIGWQQDVGLAHLEVDVYHTDFSSKAPSDSPTFGHALTLIDRKQTAFAPRVLLDFDVTRVLLGADVNHEDFRFANASTTFGDSGNEQQLRSAAAYAVLYQPVRADVDLELGLRRTNARNNATGFAGSDAIAHKFKEHDTAWETGVQWRATAALAVSARIATSFRIPKVDEQLSVFTGLKPLETQTGRSAEFTMNYQRETVAAMLNLYHIRLRHEIDFDPRADFFGDNINLRPTQRMGAIASATWNIASSLSAGINAHVVHAALSGGNTVPFVPKRSALVWVNWQPAHWLEARVESAYTGPRYAIGDYANASGEQGGFTVVNIGLRGRWRDATLTARADNVFAHRYTELVSYVGFLNALSYQPGTGRRYSVTFQYALP